MFEHLRPHRARLIAIALTVTACLSATTALAGDAVSATERHGIIDALATKLEAGYVFPDKAPAIARALRDHEKRGEYAKINDGDAFAARLTQDMQAVVPDKHLYVVYSSEAIPEQDKSAPPSAGEQAAEEALHRAHNFGIDRVERLPYNIGYLQLELFSPAKYSAPSYNAAMTLVANTDALIIDLRDNHGGDTETTTLLASYLFDGRTHLNDMYFPHEDRLEQAWTSDFVAGSRFGQVKDVYVLTSKETVSAAEDLCYALKNLKRAVIVGEVTAGGAHPGDMARLDPHFMAFVPNGRSISPITKTDWEGVGIAPDVAVPAADALKTTEVLILKKLEAHADSERTKGIEARIAKIQSGNGVAD